MALMCLLEDARGNLEPKCWTNFHQFAYIKEEIQSSFFCPFFILFLRKLQRETPEKDRQPDPELPEPVRCRWPAHTVHCKKGNKGSINVLRSAGRMPSLSINGFRSWRWCVSVAVGCVCSPAQMITWTGPSKVTFFVTQLQSVPLSQAVNLCPHKPGSLYPCLCKSLSPKRCDKTPSQGLTFSCGSSSAM